MSRKLSERKQQELIDEMLQQYEDKDYDFEVVGPKSNYPKNYKGTILEINDHGNVTVWQSFKNGNLRELASRV